MNLLHKGLATWFLGIFILCSGAIANGADEKKAPEGPVQNQQSKVESKDTEKVHKGTKNESTNSKESQGSKKEKDNSNLPKKDQKSPLDLMSAEELLNKATETKLSANGLTELSVVIALCRKAEEKGLSPDNLEFCKQLRISTQLQRGLALSQIFMQDDVPYETLPSNWKAYRQTALNDLMAGETIADNIAAVQLAIGRLNMLPGGNDKIAIKSLDTAIKEADNDPRIQTQALRYRAELEPNPAKVLSLLEKAQKNSPENAAVLAQFAQQWLRMKDYEKALLFIDKALKFDSDNKAYIKTKAFALVGLDKKKEAEELYNKITIKASNLLDLIERAEFLVSIDKQVEAIALFDKMIKENPKIPGLYYFRATLYAQNKQYKEALNNLNQCLGVDAGFLEAVQLKGVIYLQEEKFDDAIKQFETILAKKPHDASKITQLAYAWAKKGDLKKALEVLNKEPSLRDSIEILRNKGDILLMYGKWKETIDTYDKILKMSPNDSGVLNNYSWLLSTSPEDSVRNGKRALEMALKASELTYYKEAHILSTLGAAYAELGQFDKALEWSNKAVQIAKKEKHDRLEDLKAEEKSYKEKKAWREVPEKLRKK